MRVPISDPDDQAGDSGGEDLAAVGRRHPILTRMGAAMLVVIGIASTVLSTQLPFGSFLEPDTGTWPTIVSIALVIFAAISLIFPELEAEVLDTPRREVVWFSLSVGICILFAALFSLTGYFISTAVFVFAVANIFARPKWWQAALIALGSGLGIWVIFEMVLALPAP